MCFYYILAFSGYKVSVLFAGIISLGIYHGAYMVEVFRAGISSIPRGQFEAATSQGFNYVQKNVLYNFATEHKNYLTTNGKSNSKFNKNTSCLYIIGGSDLISLTYNFVTGSTTGGAYAPAYIVCGILFFIICFLYQL